MRSHFKIFLTETDPTPAGLSPTTVPDLSDSLSDADPDAFLPDISDTSGGVLPS